MEATTSIVRGEYLMLACGATYLVWWTIFFKPGFEHSLPLGLVGTLSILAAVICGAAAVLLMTHGVAALPAATAAGARGHGKMILASAVVVYVVTFVLTTVLLSRPVTTELLLIVGWLALEIYVLDALKTAGRLAAGSFAALVGVVVVVCAVCLVCYSLYYRLAPWPSYVCGCIPLVVVGFSSAALGLALRLS